MKQATTTTAIVLAMGFMGTSADADSPTPNVGETTDGMSFSHVDPWEGSYIGVGLGYGFDGDDQVGYVPGPGTAGTLEISGAYLSLRAGRDWRGIKLLWGVSALLNFGDVSDSTSNGANTANNRVEAELSLRGRVGMTQGDNLFYSFGGPSVAKMDYYANVGGTAISDNFTQSGYVIGLGWEHRLNENYTFSAEYSYTNYGKKTLSSGGQSTSSTPKYSAVQFTINRRF